MTWAYSFVEHSRAFLPIPRFGETCTVPFCSIENGVRWFTSIYAFGRMLNLQHTLTAITLNARSNHFFAGTLPPVAGGEDLHLLRPEVPGVFHRLPKTTQINHAVAHHSPIEQQVLRGHQPVA